MSSYKALAFGSYTEVKYHPFQGVDRELEQLLEPEFQVVSTEDYGRMNKAELAECRLVVSYTEFSEDKLPAEQSGALLAYVAGGGGLLVVHNGISLQRNQELGGDAWCPVHPPSGVHGARDESDCAGAPDYGGDL
ncbi:ThuA domain-containing protein [Paenibacillus rhizoplanae]